MLGCLFQSFDKKKLLHLASKTWVLKKTDGDRNVEVGPPFLSLLHDRVSFKNATTNIRIGILLSGVPERILIYCLLLGFSLDRFVIL